MAKGVQKSWGSWVDERAKVCGIKSKAAFARRLTILDRQLRRWISSDTLPPLQDRNLSALAVVLCTSEHMIQSGWESAPPKQDIVVGGNGTPSGLIPYSQYLRL